MQALTQAKLHTLAVQQYNLTSGTVLELVEVLSEAELRPGHPLTVEAVADGSLPLSPVPDQSSQRQDTFYLPSSSSELAYGCSPNDNPASISGFQSALNLLAEMPAVYPRLEQDATIDPLGIPGEIIAHR